MKTSPTHIYMTIHKYGGGQPGIYSCKIKERVCVDEDFSDTDTHIYMTIHKMTQVCGCFDAIKFSN